MSGREAGRQVAIRVDGQGRCLCVSGWMGRKLGKQRGKEGPDTGTSMCKGKERKEVSAAEGQQGSGEVGRR